MQDRLIREIQSVVSSTSQSNIPAIYGMAAAAEVKRLRPMSSEIAEVAISSLDPICVLVYCAAQARIRGITPLSVSPPRC